MSIPEALNLHLHALTRCIYYVTEEEDQFLLKFRDKLDAGKVKKSQKAFVFSATHGLIGLEQMIKDWSTRAHHESEEVGDIHEALVRAYRDNPEDKINFYIITDPDRWLQDPHVVRRILNIIHQLHNDLRTIKVLIFVGPRLYIPEKLQRYIEVITDSGLTDEEIQAQIDDICGQLRIESPAGSAKHFRGLTSYEVNSAIAQSIVRTRRDPPKRIEPRIVGEFKRAQLNKTDLVSYVDVADYTFDAVGGLQRFKKWATKNHACWTTEGQKYGLTPPKGVLAVGVWGCGKSISMKALANAWRLPLIQLEMGKLRSSGVGETEANTYRAIRLIEAVAPCLLWIDEAEKSLSGSHSSSYSDSGTTSRVVGIWSNWLQETNAQVCMAMTANSLATLPVEFVNRMDERFFFDLPVEEERVDILKIHIAAKGQDPSTYKLAKLAEAASQMVGREIMQAVNAAMTESFDQDKPNLDGEILEAELRNKPRIFKTMIDEVREILDWVGYDEERGDGIRARMASEFRGDSFKFVSGGG